MLDKETHIRETMKMMRLSNLILWTSWFTRQLLFYLLPIIINTTLLKVSVNVSSILCIILSSITCGIT